MSWGVVLAVVGVTAAAARDTADRAVTPLEAVERISEGFDPFRRPVPDRLPDDFVNGKPYWLPRPSNPVLQRASAPDAATTALAADRPSNKHDPFVAPTPDRLPDDNVDGKPYWLPKPAQSPVTPEMLSSPAAADLAADKPVAGYDPYRKPMPDRLPDDFVDGRPYWLPGPELQRTPTGFVGYSMWEAEFGARYVFSSGRTQKDVYVINVGDLLLSRLTYTGLDAHSAELYGRVEHATGFFVKGFAGISSINGGNLQDEDFPPVIDPYSSTNSPLRDGRLGYATIDFGWAWRSQPLKAGFFLGYHYYHELLNGFGCQQTTASPICVPPISTTVLAISNETNIHSIRLGFNGEWKFYPAWTATADIALLPYSWLEATDTHWLRPFVAAEKSVSISTLQIEAALRYQVFAGFSIGGGARYWKFDNTFTRLVRNDIPDPQAISLHTERWGLFAQASYKFGDLQPSYRPSGSF